ncbi:MULTISPECIES: amino acid adenylation domain-containing protein [unclassified Agrobacterium]|nr:MULTISPECIES: amino acid adenylation domain-containing protein [unclassified Agrobacterium]MDH0615168.1 amino acid adenylation domain-containing protein [Agrobacterium sp. GD03872]MDH0698215.1 amino acid adenylation domain-containing protein [Agrobacterium sp. GD03871]MDH1060241.1 amino acid adenylation domain-containing protein [Agrobacterium sp. GD03992]MDH2211997.1 amino acid adenylation domain-containing protein [Agrobacterium sp. GD03643]MDH2220290.1 amino acid adenylation domain-conta
MLNLTPMQVAYWVGREADGILGKVTPHLYLEFEGPGLDGEKLAAAVDRLCRRHPMLSLRIDAEGRQSVDPIGRPLRLDVEDMTALDSKALARRLEAKREEWSHRRADLRIAPPAAVSLSLLPGGRCRLHLDTDMLAIDPASVRMVMEDLARFYETASGADETRTFESVTPSFFDWAERLMSDPDLRGLRERDRLWWRQRLADVPDAPPLPFLPDDPSRAVRTDRFAAMLAAAERGNLERAARRCSVTTSTLLLGVFAMALSQATRAERFRLSVPAFWRAPLVEGVDGVVGEFSNVLVLGVDIRPEETLEALLGRLFDEMNGLLAHQSYPGVSVMRDLSRQRGGLQTSPVVFTAGVDLPGGELFSQRVGRVFGPMVHTVSQGPGVALDAQVAAVDGGLLINWDVRLDALPERWLRALFETYVALLRRIAESPDLACESVERLVAQRSETAAEAKGKPMERPLSPLQQAYLLGRGTHLPLSGVAMQEFREYRGDIDPELLRSRLAAMVARHESLRTRIDERRLVQMVSEEPKINLDLVDLSALSVPQAEARIDAVRRDFSHAHFDLAASPWQITVFLMPDAGLTGHKIVVFLRFDALILDGRAIASLAAELFDDAVPPEAAATAETPKEDISAVRSGDAAYWAEKLKDAEVPSQLPWKAPLETISTSRYSRQSLIVEKQRFAAFSRIGAKERLFKNSALTAVILDVLSLWLNEGALVVGIPVAPQVEGGFANRSSFIAVKWDAAKGEFAGRAAGLQTDVLEGLNHLAFSGIDLNRVLLNANSGGLALPVVLTNGLSWPTLSPGSTMRWTDGLTQTPQVALDFRFSQNPQGDLVLDVDYAEQAIDAATVADILAAIERAIAGIVDSGAFSFNTRDIVDLSHYRLNGDEGNFVCTPFLERIAGHLFEGDPSRTALVSGKRRITYGELGQMVARAMAGLKARGTGQGDVVAVCLQRSPEHTAITLAAALMGAVWVPVDAGSPEDRLRYLLTNCRPAVIVARSVPQGFDAVDPAELLSAPAPAGAPVTMAEVAALSRSEEPAYYLYTSGTTGKPKCVVLSNRATANVIGSTLAEWAVTEKDVFISVTPLHHDMSVFDVFGALVAGATLVLPEPGEEKDAVRWNELVAEHGVTLWCSVPAILEMLLSCRRGDRLASLRLIAQGGDYIKPVIIEELRRLKPGLRLISLGGPTETTIWSIWHEIVAEDVAAVPYGHPLPANRYFVLNDQGGHCPAGVVGRIHTAGVNVAIGYLEDGAITQTDFVTVADPEGNPVRAFRTGDRGRYRPDGKIMFASRVNGYVKVRGVRVSLPDVENELIRHPSIQRVLVVDYGVEQKGEAAIGVLYVVAPGLELSTADLRNFARQHLPESHVPGRFLKVDDLPLSANGKPDRRRARELLTGAAEPAKISAPAAPAVDQGDRRVLDIYLGVLGKKPANVDANSDLLALGLLPSHLKTVSAEIRTAFGVELTPQQLLRCRNARQVTSLLAARAA